MRSKDEKVITAPWDPLKMQRLNEELIDEMDRAFVSHSSLLSDNPLPDVTPVAQRPREAVARRAQYFAALERAWARCEHARGEAGGALYELLRSLPTTKDGHGRTVPLLNPIPVLQHDDRQDRHGAQFDVLEHKRRVLALECQNKQASFEMMVRRYVYERAHALPEIRKCMLVERGLSDAQIIAKLAEEDAEAARIASERKAVDASTAQLRADNRREPVIVPVDDVQEQQS